MTVTLAPPGGAATDVTQLVSAVGWAGDYRQCARTLEVSLAASPEGGVPAVDCPVGTAARMEEGGAVFSGFVFSRTKATNSSTIDLKCYDRGIYLKRNFLSRKFAGVAPEAAAAQLAGEFGIPAGTLEATGVAVRRKFINKSLYDIIMSLYTDAAGQTGRAYYLAFEDEVMCVREKGKNGSMVAIQGGSNLMDAATTESGEGIVNRVALYDKDLNLLSVREDAASKALYGTMQAALVQGGGADAAAESAALLARSGPEQRITVDLLGDVRCVTGASVFVREPYTGLYGRFFVDADTHRWQNGVYTARLVLNLSAVMDGKQAGQELEAAAAGNGTKFEQYLNNLHEQAVKGDSDAG